VKLTHLCPGEIIYDVFVRRRIVVYSVEDRLIESVVFFKFEKCPCKRFADNIAAFGEYLFRCRIYRHYSTVEAYSHDAFRHVADDALTYDISVVAHFDLTFRKVSGFSNNRLIVR